MAFSRDEMLGHIRRRAVGVLYDQGVFLDSLTAFGGGGIFLDVKEKKVITGYADLNSMFDEKNEMKVEAMHFPNVENAKRIKIEGEVDKPIKKSIFLYYLIRVSMGLVDPVQVVLRSFRDLEEEQLEALDEDIKKFIKFNKKSSLSVDVDNEFDKALDEEIKKYEIISKFNIEENQAKRILHCLTKEKLESYGELLTKEPSRRTDILNSALGEAYTVYCQNFLEEVKKRKGMFECEYYKKVYSDLVKEIPEEKLDFSREDIKKRFLLFVNPYTNKIYHEPLLDFSKILFLDSIEEEKSDRVDNLVQRKKLFDLIKDKIFVFKKSYEDININDFCTDNAESKSSYEAAISIEKQILDIEDALRDQDLTISQLEKVMNGFDGLDRKLDQLKGLKRKGLKENFSAVDKSSIKVDIKDPSDCYDDADGSRKIFFAKIVEKFNQFSLLLSPPKKEKFNVKTILSEETADEKFYNTLSVDLKSQYEKKSVQIHRRGFFSAQVDEKHYWVKKRIDLNRPIEAKYLQYDSPESINKVMGYLNGEAIEGLGVPRDNDKEIAASIALLKRLNDKKEEIEKNEEKKYDYFQKEKIAVIVTTTTDNIMTGIRSLGDAIGKRSVLRGAIEKNFKIPETTFENVTNDIRDPAKKVDPSSFAASYKDCSKDGVVLEEAKEESYKKAQFFVDDASVFSIHHHTATAYYSECRGDRSFAKNTDKIMECAAREVEAFRATLPSDIRVKPDKCYGLVITRGASMPDELVCAIQAYCEFNGYPIRSVRNGAVDKLFDATIRPRFDEYLKDVDKQLDLEKKIKIMLGASDQIQKRVDEAREMLDVMNVALKTYEESKALSEMYVVRPSSP